MRWLGFGLLCAATCSTIGLTAHGQQDAPRQQRAGAQQGAPTQQRAQPQQGAQAQGGAAAQQAAPGAAGDAKYSIKEVMENAHKAGLLKKVLENKASQAEKLTLLDHYVSLTESEPPQGSVEGWQEKANAVVIAAARVAVARDDGTELLKKATNCAACHKEHKPPTQ